MYKYCYHGIIYVTSISILLKLINYQSKYFHLLIVVLKLVVGFSFPESPLGQKNVICRALLELSDTF